MTSTLPTGTVTMLFTDIEGSTRLLRQLGAERYGDVLSDHRRLLREAFAAHGGREMDTQGDAFFYAFTRARHAAAAAADAQRALAAHTWPEGAECRVRMGLHTGEPEVGEEGYHGLGLHEGARIAHAAHGSQVLLSATTAALVRNELPPGVTLRDLGEQRLKDFDQPERIFELVVEGLRNDFPPLRTGQRRSKRRWLTVVALAAVVAGAAIAAIVLVTSGGSGQPAATAAAVSADSLGILDPATGRLTAQIDLGAAPSAVTVGAGSIWAANVDGQSVSRINPAKQVVIDTVQVGNGPAGIAYGGGFVWVTNGLDGTVSQIEPETNIQVQVIPVGNGPAGVAVGGGYVWVANSSDGTVSRIALRNDKVDLTVPIGRSADGVAVGGGSVWVTSQEAGTVTRLDARSGNVTGTVDVGAGPDAVAVMPGAVWVANSLDGTVSDVDPLTNGIRSTIPVGDGPNGIAATRDTVWVSNELSGTLARIDPGKNGVVQTVRTGNRPEDVALDGSRLYVAVRASGVGHRGGTLTLLAQPGLLFTEDPARAYSPAEWQLLIETNDGLTAFRRVGGNEGARLVPDLATSLPTPTDRGLSYTFRLRRGIHYSTGAVVRPEDIRRGIERSVAWKGVGPGGYFVEIVGGGRCTRKHCDLSKGIVVDPAASTITFHLTAPDPDFLYKLALPAAFAVPVATPISIRGPVPATGPYELASFHPRRAIRIVRNPHFRQWSAAAQPEGYPDAIVERFAGTPSAHVAAVLAAKADLADDLSKVPAPLLARVRTQHASRVRFVPQAATFALMFNLAKPPFDDVRARQALSLALDRRHLISLVGRQGAVTCQILPPNFEAYQPYCPYTLHPTADGEWTAPDLARARVLVKQSGTAGEPVTVLEPTFLDFGKASGEYVASVLRSIGYRARYGGRVDVQKIFAGEGNLSFNGWFADFLAPAGFFVALDDCPDNRPLALTPHAGGLCNAALDREFTRAHALQTTDPDRATLLWRKVDRGVTDLAPWVAYLNPGELELLSSRVGNYQYNPQWGALLDQLWVR